MTTIKDFAEENNLEIQSTSNWSHNRKTELWASRIKGLSLDGRHVCGEGETESESMVSLALRLMGQEVVISGRLFQLPIFDYKGGVV